MPWSVFRKPRWRAVLEEDAYTPTISPLSLLAWAAVETAPGKLIGVNWYCKAGCDCALAARRETSTNTISTQIPANAALIVRCFARLLRIFRRELDMITLLRESWTAGWETYSESKILAGEKGRAAKRPPLQRIT